MLKTLHSKSPSNRQLRASALVKQALVEVFLKGNVLSKELWEISVTVTEVEISPDLKVAKCSVIPLDESKISRDVFMSAIDASRFAIRAEVTRKINLKYSPDLRFYYDHSFDKARQIDNLIKMNQQ